MMEGLLGNLLGGALGGDFPPDTNVQNACANQAWAIAHGLNSANCQQPLNLAGMLNAWLPPARKLTEPEITARAGYPWIDLS